MAKEVRPNSKHDPQPTDSKKSRNSSDRENQVSSGNPKTWTLQDLTIFNDAPVQELRLGIGKKLQGLGPGPGGDDRPIPLMVHLLEKDLYEPLFLRDPQCLKALKDGSRLPPGLPPIVDFINADDISNESDYHILTRHAYTDGAFKLFENLIQSGLQLTVNEFLELATSLSRIQVFLHDNDLPGYQWNGNNIIGVPQAAQSSILNSHQGYRFDFIGSGIAFKSVGIVPQELLDKKYFPPEFKSKSVGIIDPTSLDTVSDIYILSAFLEEVLDRATSFEELSLQAQKIKDLIYRQAIRNGEVPTQDEVDDKEQEILDHLYTIRTKIEGILEEGLADRELRPTAAQLYSHLQELHEKVKTYSEALNSLGFEPFNAFEDELKRYIPYQIQLHPQSVNHFEESLVQLIGSDLPQEVTRITLGNHERTLKIEDNTGSSVTFVVPKGFPQGEHPVLINNRRTDQTLIVLAPQWLEVQPDRQRQPWDGFGDLEFTINGKDLPSEAQFALLPLKLDIDPDEVNPIVSIEVKRVQEDDLPLEEVEEKSTQLKVTFPGSSPEGMYSILCNGFDTGLELSIDKALPDPIVDTCGEPHRDLLNHREQWVPIRGKNLHPDMLVDLGEGAPEEIGLILEDHSDRRGHLKIPAGYLAGTYTLRVNKKETPHRLTVHQPEWQTISPERIKLRHKEKATQEVIISGVHLPRLDSEKGDFYELKSLTGKKIEKGIIAIEELLPQTPDENLKHKLKLSGALKRGTPRLFFAEQDTQLKFKVHRGYSPASWVGMALVGIFLLFLAGTWVADFFRPHLEPLEKNQAFNFGDDPVLVQGQRIDSLILASIENPKDRHRLTLETYDPAEPQKFFRPLGIPAGNYHLIPQNGFLEGPPSEEPFTVLSTQFELQPSELNRSVDSEFILSSKEQFPLHEIRFLILKRVLDETPKTPSPEQSKAKTLAEVPLKFPVSPKGLVKIPKGTFKPDQEGKYEVFLAHDFIEDALRAAPLKGHLTASGEEISVRVIGPKVDSIEPRPATLALDGLLKIKVLGQNFSTDQGLHFSSQNTEIEPFVLSPTADQHFEGQGKPGQFKLAWVNINGKQQHFDPIPDHTLEVLPAPRITEIQPKSLDPRKYPEWKVRGDNLKGAKNIHLSTKENPKPLYEAELTEDLIVILESGQQEATLAAPELKPGVYSVHPGGTEELKILDDCRELFKTFVNSSKNQQEMLNCLEETQETDGLRFEVADVLFDRGHFQNAYKLYAGSNLAQHQFRRQLLAREVLSLQPEAWKDLAAEDLTSIYHDAAKALGWAPGASEQKSFTSQPNTTWDLDYTLGTLTENPKEALALFTRSISKKSQQAKSFEIQKFQKALEGRVEALVEKNIRSLEQATGIEILKELETEILSQAEELERLSQASHAKLYFYLGHITYWYQGEIDKAIGFFDKVSPGESSFMSLATSYKEALIPTVKEGEKSKGPSFESPSSISNELDWFQSFISLFTHYQSIRRSQTFNILTEAKNSAAHLSNEERAASKNLHSLLQALEQQEASPDPLARDALIAYLRGAQSIAWPRQGAQSKLEQNQQHFLALSLTEENSPLRDLYLVEGKIEPLESSQLARLPFSKFKELRDRLTQVQKSSLTDALKERASNVSRKLTGVTVRSSR